MSLEEDLRTTLRDRAADAAPQPDLWSSVTDGVRRDQRRRRTLVAVAAALVVGAASATIPLLGHDRAPNPPVVQPTDRWAPPSWPEPAFPMRPTWVPGNAGTASVAVFGPNVHLEYRNADEAIISAEIGPLQADWETEAEQTGSTTVNGRPAEVHRSSQYDGSGPADRYVGIRWQQPDGRWISVLSWGPRTEADVLRFAEGLRDTGTVPAGKAPFTLATVPPGLTLAQQSDGLMCLAPPDVASRQRQGGNPVCIGIEDSDGVSLEPPLENMTINGRHAVYYEELHQMVITWSATQDVFITWDQQMVPFTRDDAIRLANGIS
ncbi:hypothetical protein [Actinoplanes sp. HUAS TT8]|uniref:hypothetical protein n=1 Tax=Actinoplanes sp. HUAS TT8 TaxID=3447453 RepID=UPI003F521730